MNYTEYMEYLTKKYGQDIAELTKAASKSDVINPKL